MNPQPVTAPLPLPPVLPGRRHLDPPEFGGVVLVGLGNDLLGDDSIGLRVTRAVRDRLGPRSRIVVLESPAADPALLHELAGFDEAVLVDAVLTGRRAAGFLHRLEGDEAPDPTQDSSPYPGVSRTLAIGRSLGLPLPRHVTVFSVEVEDPFTMSTRLSDRVAAALPGVVAAVLTHLGASASPPASG